MKILILILTMLCAGVSFADQNEEKVCIADNEKKTITCVGDEVNFPVHDKTYEGTVLSVDANSKLVGLRSTNWRDAVIWQGYKKVGDLSPKIPCYKDFCVGDRVLFEVHGKYYLGEIRFFTEDLARIENETWKGYKYPNEIFRAP